MSNADEAKMVRRRGVRMSIKEAREQLMEMDLAELKDPVLTGIKDQQPDVELPRGGKEEIVAWAIEWFKAREEREEEASKPDQDTLRAMRAASPALQEWWPDGESPRSWQGITWSDDRVQKLNFHKSKLEVLSPQIGQLQALTILILNSCLVKDLPPEIGQLKALTELYLEGCPLKVLPPEFGQLLALTYLDLENCPLKELPPELGQLLALTKLFLRDCEQLTLAPGAEEGQPAQTTVAAYARLLIVEPHKDAPGQLHAFLLAKPLAVPAFFKFILTWTSAAHVTWLGEAFKATPPLAQLTDTGGRRAIDVVEEARLSRANEKPDEVTLRAMRAASPALQEWWPDGESPRSWRGVWWSDDRVTELDLHGSKLEVLPPQIGQLQALINLELNHCLLEVLPPQIGQLQALRALSLYGCPLKVLPPEIGQLKALTDLRLSGCPLKELPPEIGQLRALTVLVLDRCPLEVLPPEFGQLLALTELQLIGCSLATLPPEIGQLLALTSLSGLHGCSQLTLAPGAKAGQPVQTIVAVYARLLIVEPRKDTPDQLHAFLLANPLVVPAFFKTILADTAHAAWLGEAVKAAPSLAGLTDADGRRAIDVAHSACKLAMQAALFLLGRFEVDVGKLLHRSTTAAVAAATDHDDPEARPAPRVALKAMREVEQVCAELKGRVGLDPKYVIAIKAVYADEEVVDAGAWETVLSAAAGLEDVVLERVPGLSSSIQAHLFTSKQEADQVSAAAAPGARRELKQRLSVRTLDASSEYKLLVVLELADRNLKHTIDHEQIAGKDWPAIRHIASNLGLALDHVHGEGGIHADFKPLNAVGDRDTWKIIDFDVFCNVDQPFGNKVPSSGFCPPEMAKVLLAATNQDTGEVDTSLLKEYMASEAYDLWSFGVVLYHLCFGTPLWKTDTDDNVDFEGLQLLASVSVTPLRAALDKALNKGVKRSASEELKTATALLSKLLEPDPSKRLGYFKLFGTPMEGVLEEPFFQGQSLDGATLQQMCELLVRVDGKLDQVLEKLNANFKMLSTLLKGVGSVAPKLICFLPVSAVREDNTNKDRWWEKALSPKDWLNQRVLVFFFDPIQLKLADTNPDAEGKGQGFEIAFPKAWVVKAMPYVKLGLAVLKAAAIAGRLSGFPVPDIAGVIGGWMGEQLKALDGLKEEAMESLSRQTKDPELARSLFKQVDGYVTKLPSATLEDGAPVSGEPLDAKIVEPLRKSVEELDLLLPEADGTSEWVRPEDVERFKIKGEALLGKEAKVNEGALSQLGVMHQQLMKSQTAQHQEMQQQLVNAKEENDEQKQRLIDAQKELLARRGCKSCGCVLS